MKTNLKTKSIEPSLFWKSTYSFIVPHNIDECIRRINALGTKYWDEYTSLWSLISARFAIDSQQDNGGVFNFKMSGSMSKVMLDVKLYGQLINVDNTHSCVKIKVGFTTSSTVFLIVFLPIICILGLLVTGNSPYSIPFAVAFYGIILLIQLVFGYMLKVELFYDLREALLKDISAGVTSNK